MTGGRATQAGVVHRRLHTYVGAVAAVGAVCTAWAVASLLHSPPHDWPAVALAVATLIVGRLMALRVRFGGTHIQFDWAEAALIIAVVLVPGPVVVLGAAVAITAVMAWRRTDPLKQLFNVSTAVITATTVSWIAHSVAPGPALDPMTVTGALAILAGIGTYPLLNDLAVGVAMAHDRGAWALRTFLAERNTILLTFVGNVAVAFGVLALWAANPLFLVLCPPILWLVHQAYIGRIQTRLERVAWQRLAAAIHGLASLEESEVVGAAVRGAADLFCADVVEVEIVDDSGGRRLTRGDAHGYLWSGAPGGEARTESSVLSAPLADGKGEVRLCFRCETTLVERDRLALATFTDALSAALCNAQRHDRLRTAASRKEHDATHDDLTGLPNRNCLISRGERLRARPPVEGEEGGVALLLLDLDRFKEVNDTLGHAAGDLLLASAAARLGAERVPKEMLARLGGDEFALLLPRLPTAATASVRAEERARDLLAALSEPIIVHEVALTVEASVGLAVTPLTGGCDTAELLRRAEVAMYQAKRTGGRIAVYDAAKDAGTVDRLALAAELRAALGRSDELVLYLQPSIDLGSGAPIGVEALVRWEHPRRGPMLPSEFVPLVEHTDLVRPFSRYVVDRALEISAGWLAEGLRLPIAVNLSARSLLDRDLPADVGALLAAYRVPADLLVLEITETVVMSDLDVVEEVLGGLRTLGVRLSVDDFGTGYSSLNFLARVAVDEVKIDRSFVWSMTSSAEGAAIVRATVEIGRSLGLRVVAEGVERAEQLAVLTRLGCDAAQGNHLFPPMTVDAATEALWSVLAGADRERGVARLGRGRRNDER